MEVFQLIAVLLVIGGIFYLAWFIPRVLAKRSRFGLSAGRRIQILEKVPVAKDSYLLVVKMSGRLLVMGVTPGGFTSLGELDPALAEQARAAPDDRKFSDILRETLSESLPEGRIRDTFENFIGRTKKKGEKEKDR